MANNFFKIRSYFSYWLDAVDEHSLHSPFLFDFYMQVVKKKYDKNGIASIEKLRQKLLHDKRPLTINDLGAKAGKETHTIATIARNSLSPIRFSDLYSRIIQHFKSKTILELGTSFGINTLYLAQKKDARVTTFEGVPEIADIAKLTFEFSEASNIQMIQGNIDSTLPAYLQSIRKVDLIFMDANHRYQPTLNYFERLIPKITETSILIIDDIHYSAGMEKAWEQIKKHKIVYGSADLYRCGILFFDPSLNKQHVILQY